MSDRRTYDENGDYDEIVRTNSTIHIERLNDDEWMLAIDKPDGGHENYVLVGQIHDNYEITPEEA